MTPWQANVDHDRLPDAASVSVLPNSGSNFVWSPLIPCLSSHSSQKHSETDLISKLLQHTHQLRLIDDTPVGSLALEGDHARHRLASLRGWQVCRCHSPGQRLSCLQPKQVRRTFCHSIWGNISNLPCIYHGCREQRFSTRHRAPVLGC